MQNILDRNCWNKKYIYLQIEFISHALGDAEYILLTSSEYDI